MSKHGKVIARASRKASKALIGFKKMHDALEKANVKLALVSQRAREEAQAKLEKAQREAADLFSHADQADKSINANFKVQTKLKDFVE